MLDLQRQCGGKLLGGGRARWRVWAPRCRRVELMLEGQRVEMEAKERGHFEWEGAADAGTRYAFVLEGEKARADPCSLWQPEGPAGKSALFDPAAFTWSDSTWRGVERRELVFYELHVGTFTPEGTFEAVIPRLKALRDLGVTALELMPIGQFSGDRNWGYDGVLPYAAQHSYGGPAGLQKLVDAAHGMGLAVFLDAVYNHMGPEHNYLDDFGPYFTDHYKTPWGRAMNFDGAGSDGVRAYVLENVRMWLEEFRVDGLRLDAVHAIYDFGARHILGAIQEIAADVEARNGRRKQIVAESDLNDPRVVLPKERGGHGLAAQWSDDFHHAVHVLMTGERRGNYADFQGAADLGPVMESPFLIAGTYSAVRQRTYGATPEGISGEHFVVCIQNHDQVGNRALGDRMATLVARPENLRLAACLMLFAPYLPLLFMGEEYGETNPFPFFCSFEGSELVEAVRAGRRREFADFAGEAAVPDPQATATFESAKLSWSWPPESGRDTLRRLYGDALRLRRTWGVLRDFDSRAAAYLPAMEPKVLQLVRGGTHAGEPGTAVIYFNLTDEPQPVPRYSSVPAVFSSEAERYGGTRRGLESVEMLMPFECLAYHFKA